jgi:hypothetical protein
VKNLPSLRLGRFLINPGYTWEILRSDQSVGAQNDSKSVLTNFVIFASVCRNTQSLKNSKIPESEEYMSKFGGSKEYGIPVIINGGERRTMLARRLFGSSLCAISQSGTYQGWAAYPKWDPEAKKQGRKPISADVAYVAVPDWYCLHRLLIHGGERYQQDQSGEIPNLAKSLHHLGEIHRLLLDKSDSRRLQELIEEIRSEVAAVLACLGPNARNTLKRRATEAAAKVALGEDSRGRFNPGAFAARIITAINDVLIREQDAVSIDAIFAQWRRLTQSILCLLEFEVDAQYAFLWKVLSDWDNLATHHTKALITRLNRNAAGLAAYDLNPFRETFEYVALEMEEAAHFLETHCPLNAKVMLETAKSGFWLRKVRVALEGAMLAVSRKHRFPIVTFNKPAVIRTISANADEIEKLDTRHMRSFDQKLVAAGLRGVITALELPDWELAHQRLREVIVRI